MKKISLKDVKNGLKRDEMRTIQGGSGQSYNSCMLTFRANNCSSCDYMGSMGWLCRVG